MIGTLPPSPPALVSISVTNGSTPFAGDGQLLTTVSPNADGFRDRAIVHFRLTAPARVRMDAVRTDTIRTGRNPARVVWSTNEELGAGPQLLVWKPARSTPPRTYILRLTVTDAHGRKRVYSNPGPGGPVKAPVVRVQGIDAGFLRLSYAPGEAADVSIATDARSLKLQVFSYGNELNPTERDLRSGGEAMTTPVQLDWTAHRDAPQPFGSCAQETGRAASTSFGSRL